MSFEMINDENPIEYLNRTLETLLTRIDSTIFFIESKYDASVKRD